MNAVTQQSFMMHSDWQRVLPDPPWSSVCCTVVLALQQHLSCKSLNLNFTFRCLQLRTPPIPELAVVTSLPHNITTCFPAVSSFKCQSGPVN